MPTTVTYQVANGKDLVQQTFQLGPFHIVNAFVESTMPLVSVDSDVTLEDLALIYSAIEPEWWPGNMDDLFRQVVPDENTLKALWRSWTEIVMSADLDTFFNAQKVINLLLFYTCDLKHGTFTWEEIK